MTSSLEGKARKKVVLPTPARSAMSSTVERSYPRSSNNAKAAEVSRSLTEDVSNLTPPYAAIVPGRTYGTEFHGNCIRYHIPVVPKDTHEPGLTHRADTTVVSGAVGPGLPGQDSRHLWQAPADLPGA